MQFADLIIDRWSHLRLSTWGLHEATFSPHSSPTESEWLGLGPQRILRPVGALLTPSSDSLSQVS